MTDAIRVMCVDDHQILREGVAAILMREPDMDVVGQASGGAEAVSLFKTLRPDVTLMDIQMPDMDGIETMKAIRDEFSRLFAQDHVAPGIDRYDPQRTCRAARCSP